MSTSIATILENPLAFVGQVVSVTGDLVVANSCILVPYVEKRPYDNVAEIVSRMGGVILKFPGLGWYLGARDLTTVGGPGIARVVEVSGIIQPSTRPVTEYMLTEITVLNVVGGWAASPNVKPTRINEAIVRQFFDQYASATQDASVAPEIQRQYRQSIEVRRALW